MATILERNNKKFDWSRIYSFCDQIFSSKRTTCSPCAARVRSAIRTSQVSDDMYVAFLGSETADGVLSSYHVVVVDSRNKVVVDSLNHVGANALHYPEEIDNVLIAKAQIFNLSYCWSLEDEKRGFFSSDDIQFL